MMHTAHAVFASLSLGLQPASTPAGLPEVVVDRDNFEIRESCVVKIAPGLVIADTDGNGVIHVKGDDIVIDFGGSVLRGAAEGTPWNTLSGTGIMIDTQRGVVLQNIAVHGYKVGVFATIADGLEVTSADLSDNYRQRLGSTPEREDSGDWLFPHHNDENEWVNQHGAALYVEETDNALIRRVRVRRGQNGILLDRVRDSEVYDNDCSFLSGWGLGLWRSTGNTITRNHFDFCVRGHSEGVYNRGQDSAGIIMFEQSSDNVIAENSITHGGDGIFGFGGLDALGEAERNAARDRLRAESGEDAVDDLIDYGAEALTAHTRTGCNNNIFALNDLSYAPAHGLEMTFSFENFIYRNRFSGNAICGIWGGFSQDTLIMENLFEDNGGMAYGLERGGVNIEHSAGNRIINNRFVNNRAGVHIWWDALGDFGLMPWAKANYRGVAGNTIADNAFVVDAVPDSFHRMSATERMVAVQLRNDGGLFEPVGLVNNTFEIDGSIGERLRQSGETPIAEDGPIPGFYLPEFEVLGESRPVMIEDGVPTSVRGGLRGRDQIVMDEWGPWDHAAPLLRPVSVGGGRAVYEVLGVDAAEATAEGEGYSVSVVPGPIGHSMRVEVEANEGVVPYRVGIVAAGLETTVSGTLIRARWLCRAFSWADGPDPREDFDGWRALARGPGSRPFGVRSLSLPFGMGGPVELAASGLVEDTSGRLGDAAIGSNHFGIEAVGRLRMPEGRWRIRSVSDDGIRISVVTSSNRTETVIDNWTWHAPVADEGTFTVSTENELVMIRVLHFEIDGFATLELDLERLP